MMYSGHAKCIIQTGAIWKPLPCYSGGEKEKEDVPGRTETGCQAPTSALGLQGPIYLHCSPEHCPPKAEVYTRTLPAPHCPKLECLCKSQQKRRMGRARWVSLLSSLLADLETCSAGEGHRLKQMWRDPAHTREQSWDTADAKGISSSLRRRKANAGRVQRNLWFKVSVVYQPQLLWPKDQSAEMFLLSLMRGSTNEGEHLVFSSSSLPTFPQIPFSRKNHLYHFPLVKAIFKIHTQHLVPFLSTYISEGCFLRKRNIGFIPSDHPFIPFLLSIALSYIQIFLISRCKESCMLTGTIKKQGWEKKINALGRKERHDELQYTLEF